MDNGIGPALVLGARERRLSPEKELAERIQMVLETRPGTLPYRRDFGCDFSGVVGQMATNEAVSKARAAVVEALRKWLPDLEIAAVNVRVVPRGATFTQLRYPEVPVAERALLALGTQADLEVSVELRSAGPHGVVRTAVGL